MKARLYFQHADFTDSMEIEADTLDELREIGNKELKRRSPDDYWSEIIPTPNQSTQGSTR